MRFLAAAVALLLVGVASAVQSDLQLSYPEFQKGRTHTYDICINITSGVPGMHPQIAKSAMKMELKVYAKTKHDLYVSITKVKVSNSIPSVGSLTDPVNMETNTELEEHLKIPIKVTFENGKVKSYSLDRQESLESKKIKKTILRHFELQLDKNSLKTTGRTKWPITYNHTRSTPVGNYSSHYIITSSSYPDFPKDHNVINITRTDNLEVIPYLAYHTHHNFEEQGCPGVCKKDHVENRFGAGCPVEWEPYQTPMKKSFVQHHNLRKVKGTLIVDIVKTKETHVADIYDQNLEVTIESYIQYKHTDKTHVDEPTGQRTYTDLNDWNVEASEEEIKSHCKYTTAEQAIPTVQGILNHITEIVHKGSIDGEAKNIGEKLVLLQKALTLLKHKDFDKIQEDIVSYGEISQASEEDKIKRQLWLDNLPLIGTPDSISFIVDLIKKSINEKHEGVISLWESKSILEALPMNILKPNSKTIQDLSELLEILHERTVPGYGMYYSAAYIAVARVIRNMCAVSNGIPEVEKDSRANYLQLLLRETDDDYKNSRCPKTEAKRYIKDIAEKLKGNPDRLKRIIYIEALSQTGLRSVIPILKPIVEGYMSEATPSYRDYVRTVAINALHNLVGKYPKQIKDIVLPIFTNKTDPPKIRTSAFSVFIRSYPTLGDLQHVAEQTWNEPSIEVGSHVTSTLETFGNSSIPCDQLTNFQNVRVFKNILKYSQIFQNVKLSFKVVTPPAAVAGGWSTTHDIFAQLYALNSQGFNSLNLWDNVLRFFKLKAAEDIPKSKESQIFPEIEMADRANEFWRFTIFEKLFYSMSYYYMDDQEFQNGDIIALLTRHIKNYFKVEGDGNIHGHLVKVWMPSSYQSKAIAQTLPYPVQFEMRNPMLLSLKLNIKRQEAGYSVDVRPSYYHSMLYTNQMLNLGDCKHVGVYHEKKLAGTYPFKFTFALNQGRYDLSYSFPTLPKKIFVYHSEAGTFASKHTLEVQPLSTEKKTIKTIPQQFVRNSTFGVVGLPLFASSVLTEDINLGFEELPRSKEHAMYQIIKDFLNAGWRRKTIEISRQLDKHRWGPKTEVKMHIAHRHEYVKTKEQAQSSDDSWMNDIGLDEHDEKNYVSEERTVNDKIKQLSHHRDSLSLTVEHKVSDKVSNKAHLEVVYRRTLEGNLHTVYCNGTAKVHGITFGAITNASALFYNRPNEFKYGDDGYGKQKGVIFGAIRFPGSNNPYIVTKVILSHKPLDQYLNKELQTPVPAKYFYPETHDQCVRDVQKGSAHSVACIKAIRERAIFNRANALFIWQKDLPTVVEDILDITELAVKHTYFHHLSIEKKKNRDKILRIDLTYVNKLTDKPVVDVVITKPTEVLKLHKVDPTFIQPMSSIYNVPDTYIQYYTNNTYPATCALMKENVRTYDLKTIRLPRDKSCSYVLTSHCVRHKKFAVIVKIDPQNHESKEIYVYIGKHSLVLKPGTEWKYEIQYDKTTYTVNYMQPIMLHETEKIYAVTTRMSISRSSFIEIHAEKAGIKVTYDGQHAKIQVHPRYKGELCGLCSEFDGEVVREFRGPSRCLFSHVDDYTASSALGSCYKPQADRAYICSGEDYDYADIQDQDELDETDKEYEPKVRRNRVLPKDEKLCFSTTALPVCNSRDVPKETKVKRVKYHCLPKDDNHARKLVAESKRRILGELETKEVDYEDDVEYPIICTHH
ncbi:hypothetical protein AVEN_113955-1 [Araneus ventricosus]|uniref:Vitellogenin n=1 Tax=Araneus ventricosus TaxID=182803 RepID=A0A4Y2IVB5_ARAVE|nr:hypothetical protein AVEN_113955-1 [Araneus ventricosus]